MAKLEMPQNRPKLKLNKTEIQHGVISAKLEIKETNHKASLHEITVLGMQPITT